MRKKKRNHKQISRSWDRSWRLESISYKQETGDTERLLRPGAPQGPVGFHRAWWASLPMLSLHYWEDEVCLCDLTGRGHMEKCAWFLLDFTSSFPLANFNLYSSTVCNRENNGFPEFCELFCWVWSWGHLTPLNLFALSALVTSVWQSFELSIHSVWNTLNVFYSPYWTLTDKRQIN